MRGRANARPRIVFPLGKLVLESAGHCLMMRHLEALSHLRRMHRFPRIDELHQRHVGTMTMEVLTDDDPRIHFCNREPLIGAA
jgi:hypothetical protein